MTKDEYINKLTEMVYDVNAAEIASHIENDTLRAWCHGWGSEMLNRIMMVNLLFLNQKNDEDGEKSRWILCSERLPEEYRRVLIKHKDKTIDESVGYLMGSKEWCVDSGGYSKFDRVIAWMPIPEYMEAVDEE